MYRLFEYIGDEWVEVGWASSLEALEEHAQAAELEEYGILGW